MVIGHGCGRPDRSTFDASYGVFAVALTRTPAVSVQVIAEPHPDAVNARRRKAARLGYVAPLPTLRILRSRGLLVDRSL